MLMIQENEAPEVHEGPERGEKWHGKVTERKKKGITFKRLGPSSVFFYFFPASVCSCSSGGSKRMVRLRRGGQADSISPPEMDGGRRDGGVSTEGDRAAGERGVKKKEDWPQEREEAPLLNRWKYDDDL